MSSSVSRILIGIGCLAAGVLGAIIPGSVERRQDPSSITSAPPTQTSGNGIATPTPFQPGMATNCDEFHLVESGDNCFAIAQAAGVSLVDFYSWNPGVGSNCESLWLSYYVCVGTTDGTSPSSTASPTSSGGPVATPTPIQDGMTTECKTFYLVQSGDNCFTITQAAGVSLADFYSWNTGVGSGCESLWLGYYVCIGV